MRRAEGSLSRLNCAAQSQPCDLLILFASANHEPVLADSTDLRDCRAAGWARSALGVAHPGRLETVLAGTRRCVGGDAAPCIRHRSIAGIFGIGVAVLEKPVFWRVSRVGLIVGLVPTVFFALTQWPRLPSASAMDVVDAFVWPVSICLLPTVVCWLVVRAWVGRFSRSVIPRDTD